MTNRNAEFDLEVPQHLSYLKLEALRLKRNEMDADDLVQETLCRAVKFWEQFSVSTNCRAWLHRILRNQHIDEWRVKSNRVDFLNMDLVSEAEIAHYCQQPQEFHTRGLNDSLQLYDTLYSAIGQLKAEFRTVVLLHYFAGLPYKKIAQETGQSVGTIKSRLYRSRQLLRRSLDGYACIIGVNENRRSKGRTQ